MEQEKLDTLFKLIAQALEIAEKTNKNSGPFARAIKQWMLENAPEYLSNNNQ